MTQDRPRRALCRRSCCVAQASGLRRRLKVAGPIADLDVRNSRWKPGSAVDLDVVLESVLGGVVVTGTVSARWEGECSRCLEAATGRLVALVREVYTDQADPEIEYTMTDDWLDLEPLAHDACILELPLAPLCGPDCLGLCRSAARTVTARPAPAPRRPTHGGPASPGLVRSKRYPSGESDDGSPQEEDLEVEEPKPASVGLDAGGALAQTSAPSATGRSCRHVICPHCGWYKGRQAVEVN